MFGPINRWPILTISSSADLEAGEILTCYPKVTFLDNPATLPIVLLLYVETFIERCMV